MTSNKRLALGKKRDLGMFGAKMTIGQQWKGEVIGRIGHIVVKNV